MQILQKKLATLLLAITALCSSYHAVAKNEIGTDSYVGDIAPEVLLKEYPQFNSEYKKYFLGFSDEKNLEKALLNTNYDIELTVYFGTWCHDSVREIPRILKLVEQKEEKMKVRLIAVGKDKKIPEGIEAETDLKRTPTVVVKTNGEIVGEIVESPKISWASDIAEKLY